MGLWENFLRYFCGQGSFAQSLYLPLVGRNFPLYAIMPVQLFHFAFQNQLVVDDTSLLLHCCLWPTPGLVSVWLYSVCRVLLHSIHPIQASRWMLPGFQEPVHALHYHPQSVHSGRIYPCFLGERNVWKQLFARVSITKINLWTTTKFSFPVMCQGSYPCCVCVQVLWWPCSSGTSEPRCTARWPWDSNTTCPSATVCGQTTGVQYYTVFSSVVSTTSAESKLAIKNLLLGLVGVYVSSMRLCCKSRMLVFSWLYVDVPAL